MVAFTICGIWNCIFSDNVHKYNINYILWEVEILLLPTSTFEVIIFMLGLRKDYFVKR